MKPKIVGEAREGVEGKFFHTFRIDRGPDFRTVEVSTDLSSLVPVCTSFAESFERPYRIALREPWKVQYWLFRAKIVAVDEGSPLSEEQRALEVMHTVLGSDRRYETLRRMMRNLRVMDDADSARREIIPEATRVLVWQRDEGKCVRCGSQERLEFDHIIPVAKGGGSTARNVQLLCEACNRAKGVSI